MGQRENVAIREMFTTNGKDKRNICEQRGIARLLETATLAETYSRCRFHFNLVKTKKETIECFITFSSSPLMCVCGGQLAAMENRPRFKIFIKEI